MQNASSQTEEPSLLKAQLQGQDQTPFTLYSYPTLFNQAARFCVGRNQTIITDQLADTNPRRDLNYRGLESPSVEQTKDLEKSDRLDNIIIFLALLYQYI